MDTGKVTREETIVIKQPTRQSPKPASTPVAKPIKVDRGIPVPNWPQREKAPVKRSN